MIMLWVATSKLVLLCCDCGDSSVSLVSSQIMAESSSAQRRLRTNEWLQLLRI